MKTYILFLGRKYLRRRLIHNNKMDKVEKIKAEIERRKSLADKQKKMILYERK